MEKEFVTYEQALALKELGFDEPCLAWHNSGRMFKDNYDAINSKMDFDYCCALPLKQQVFRWFRDKHNLDLHIKLNWRQSDFISYILSVNYPTIYDIDFDTYEEAEEFAINVLIQIAEEQELERNL